MAQATQQGTLAFKRVYVDLPPDAWDKLKSLARERGMSGKALLAELITREAGSNQKRSKRK